MNTNFIFITGSILIIVIPLAYGLWQISKSIEQMDTTDAGMNMSTAFDEMSRQKLR
tara:strand:- start:335 stop:502 length:168 start_codon:yes stop_codon:yes gene_type:complete